MWADPTDPDAVALYYHVYVWNVTNPEAVLHGAKPELTEVGPYVYRDMQARFNVSFEQDEELRHVMKVQPSCLAWLWLLPPPAPQHWSGDGV